jgi:hypothetical protein
MKSDDDNGMQINSQPGLARAIGFSATVRINYPRELSWKQKWNDIEHQLEDLRTLYFERPAISNVQVRILVEGVLKSCRELADWLWENPSVPLTKKQVETFMYGNPHLKIADGLAQTSKHFRREVTRKCPDPITAWFDWVEIPCKAQIRWDSQLGGHEGHADALQIAQDCVEAWRTYLKAHHNLL